MYISEITCPADSPALLNGTVQAPADTSFNTSTNYTCDADYTPAHASGLITCLETGEWDTPVCEGGIGLPEKI